MNFTEIINSKYSSASNEHYLRYNCCLKTEIRELKQRLPTFQYRYQIDKYENSEQIGLSAYLSVCFDSEVCAVELPLLSNQIMPNPLCTFDGTFKLPGKYFDI